MNAFKTRLLSVFILICLLTVLPVSNAQAAAATDRTTGMSSESSLTIADNTIRSTSAEAPRRTTVPVGKYDDTDSNWTYSGTWSTYNGEGPYHNTSHYSLVPASDAQITFNGAKFTLTYVKAYNRGLIDVYVDGVKIATINAYKSSTAWQQTWTSPTFPAGEHTARFVHAGGGTYIDIDAIEIFAGPSPVTAGIYDDDHASWTFSSGWSTYSGSGPYNSTLHFASTVGNEAQISFNGTQFILTYVKASNRGLIDIYVDGSLVDTVNAYSSTLAWRQTWTSPIYTLGVHAVRIVHAGGGTYIDVDAIEVLAPPPAVPAGVYDDPHASWIFSSGWTTYAGPGPYNSTLHYSKAIGSEARITFNGNRFNLIYVKATDRGLIDVYVDGVKIATVNANGPTTAWQQIWTSPVLTSAVHTVRFVHAGGGTYIDIDGIEILNPSDVTAPAAIGDLAAATGTIGGSVRLTWTAVGDDGGVGTATSYLVRYSTAAINSEATWNAATPVTSGIPTPGIAGQSESMIVSGLTPGATYYFAVRARDEALNLGGLSNSPSAVAQSPTPAPVGKYDDTDSSWVYSGSWATYSGSGPYSNTLHYANTVGSEAQFTFNGRRFTLTYVRANNRGSIDVYVDGGLVYTINANSSTLAWQQTWTSPLYALGVHTVRFVHAGGGTYIDVDAIQISNPSDTTAPAAIGSLSAVPGSSTGTVTLTWTAPGDDNNTGTANSYLVRYSLSAINNETDWMNATPVTTGIPTPVAAGGAQTMTISGLTPRVPYYFAVRAQDEEANLGGLSNFASAAAASSMLVSLGKYDDNHIGWTYTGTWVTYSGTGPYNDTTHYTLTAGNQASFTFTGSKFTLTYVKAYNRGLIDVYVDGTKITTINAYKSSTAWQQTWTSPLLTTGTHTVTFVHAGGGTYIDIDALEVFGPPPALGAGTYDDNHMYWVFSSGWLTYSGAGPYNTTLHYTNTVGSQAWFTFNGQGFTLTYVKSNNRGLIDVYVDGVKIDTINANAATTMWQQTWTSPVLAPVDHTVRFVHAGGSGTYIDVDAITVIP